MTGLVPRYQTPLVLWARVSGKRQHLQRSQGTLQVLPHATDVPFPTPDTVDPLQEVAA